MPQHIPTDERFHVISLNPITIHAPTVERARRRARVIAQLAEGRRRRAARKVSS
ncbi:hypothetical protein ACFVVX_28735 [Kitasatospora sp. NPDC058170]|uniref:hypothetical protein n=1 Tax=Kitasatospora sp. NPDC058170 TaxID=3346364 RepID=UPI0036D9CE42